MFYVRIIEVKNVFQLKLFSDEFAKELFHLYNFIQSDNFKYFSN